MKTRLLVAFALGLGLTLALVWLLGGGRLPVARAASIGVNTTLDDTANNHNCTLREAIIAANTDSWVDSCSPGSGADYIALGNGTYLLTIGGAGEDACTTGDLDITATLTIEGAGPGQTIIDAGGIDRVFDVRFAGTVVISGVRIINGNVTGDGGGIDSLGTDLTLINVEVVSNTSSGLGGGVSVYAGSATLNGGQILNNSANSYGGGVLIKECDATLNGTQVVSNSAGQRGGGLYVLSGGATLNGGQVLSNTAQYGGGVGVDGTAPSGDGVFTQTGDSLIAYNVAATNGGGVYVNDAEASAFLSGGQIFSNTATGTGVGGGVYVGQGSVTLNGSQVLSNVAGSGGGLYLYESNAMLSGQIRGNIVNSFGGGVHISHGSVVLHGAQIVSNTASVWYGGGMYVSGAVTVSLVNSTVSHNESNRNGGGVYVGSEEASVSLLNSTVSHNKSNRNGGGLYVSDGTVAITYTTIASNTASSGTDGIHQAGGTVALLDSIVASNGAANCAGTLASHGHNLDSGATCGFTATGDLTNTNPLLGPLTEENGSWVHPLLPGSPAIDAGACVAGITADQRGVTRPSGDGCDIGAYEFPIAPTSVAIGGPTEGAVGESYVFTASASPPTSTLPLTYTWSPVPDGGQGTSVATYTWGVAGNKQISVTVENVAGAAPGTHVIVIEYKIYLPLVLRNH